MGLSDKDGDAPRRVHLDTKVLRAALGAEDDEDLEDRAKKLLFRRSPPVACASFPVLGELLMTLQRDFEGQEFVELVGKLYNHTYKNRLVTFGFGQNDTRVFDTAMRLRQKEKRLQPTDTIILACALEDQQADGLYAIDQTVLESRVVRLEAAGKSKFVREPP